MTPPTTTCARCEDTGRTTPDGGDFCRCLAGYQAEVRYLRALAKMHQQQYAKTTRAARAVEMAMHAKFGTGNTDRGTP